MSLNPMDLSGRTVLVTGASSGIGRATSILLSRLNAKVILVARNTERLGETLSSLEGFGHHCEPFDLASLDAIPGWLKGVASRHGLLDGAVHCAGTFGVVPLRTLTSTFLERMLQVNLNAAIMLAKGLRQKGCHAERCSLVLISSVAGMRGHAALSAYTATKAALIGVTKSLAMELAREGIRVNVVSPGVIATEMAARAAEETWGGTEELDAEHPLGIGHPLDVANGIAFLLSDAARWMTGANLVIDGGYTAH